MTYYVLRQIRPPGMLPVATHNTAVELAAAAVEGKIVVGKYLEWSDPDARDGRGDDRWTDDLAKAKKFATFMDAMECWKAQSTVVPFRPDGKPNRPMTAYSVTPEKIDER
jgi:hypothetical protein